jgi:hypothetical protein
VTIRSTNIIPLKPYIIWSWYTSSVYPSAAVSSALSHNQRWCDEPANRPQTLAEHEEDALELAVVEEEGKGPERPLLREWLAISIGVVAEYLAVLWLNLGDDGLPKRRGEQAVLLPNHHREVPCIDK